MDFSGIYKIVDKKGRFYIGSSKHCNRRFREHLTQLNRKRHFNKKLTDRYKKYGRSYFELVIIEVCPEDVLLEREQFYIDSYRPFYNVNLFTVKPPCQKGKPRSAETIAKIKAARWKHTPEALAKMKEARNTPEGKEKQRQRSLGNKNWLGKKHGENFKRIISQVNKGKIVSDETREKLRIANTGRILSEESRLKMSVSQTGRKHSVESLEKMKNTAKDIWSRPGYREMRSKIVFPKRKIS